MKRKLNLSKAGIKQLALAHGEKAVFGLGVLIFVLFVYAFFGRVTLPPEKGPQKLSEKASAAQRYMDESKWDEKREQLAIADYVKRAKREPLAPGDYALKMPFDMPPRPQMSKRADPALLAVESLQANGGQGPFELKQATGTVEARGQRWAMVTGLVPIKKQIAAYEEVFRDSIPITESGRAGDNNRSDAESLRDTPLYKGQPLVQRAEVVDGKEKDLQWTDIDMVKIVKMKEEWAGTHPEIVSSEFVDPVYTKELGPLASGDWDEKAAHLPEIPLATETERAAEEARREAERQAHEEAIKKRAQGIDESADAARRGAAAPVPVDPMTAKTQRKAVDYRLFRFIDLTVEPNKRYRYRVRLTTANPNYGLPEKYLKDINSRTIQYRKTPWSEPSPIVDIPRGEGILVGHPKPPARPTVTTGDPPATLLVYTIEPTTGLEAAAERQVSRGSVLNFMANVQLFNPVTKKHEGRDVAFKFNALVVDIRGGREFPHMVRDKIMEPSEVLLFDGASRLVAHSELDEAQQFAKHAPEEMVAESADGPSTGPKDKHGSHDKKKSKKGGSGNLLEEDVRKPPTSRK